MSEFTKGTWEYDRVSGCVHHNGRLIAEVAGGGGANYCHSRGEANARLIAAAPDMYELLKVWVNVQAQPTLRNTQKMAQELLARINGDSNAQKKEPEP
jgi:hypothetical protein